MTQLKFSRFHLLRAAEVQGQVRLRHIDFEMQGRLCTRERVQRLFADRVIFHDRDLAGQLDFFVSHHASIGGQPGGVGHTEQRVEVIVPLGRRVLSPVFGVGDPGLDILRQDLDD